MAEGIRAPNLPLGTSLSEFIGLETVGTAKSVKRFTRASVIGGIEAVANSFTVGGGVIFSTLSQALANLNYAANQMAWVIQDATAANNGVYQKTGSSGSGSWSRLGDLPYSFYRAVNEGAGTANAIQATNGYPMANKDALIVVNITDTNTATPVTLSLNGDTPLTIKTAAGNDPTVGALIAGMMVAGYIDAGGTQFRMLSDQASAAIQAASETAQAAAEAARDVATGAMSAVLVTSFDTKATAEAYSPAGAPTYIRLEGYTAPGDGGRALYEKVASEPTSTAKLSITLSDGVTVVWYQKVAGERAGDYASIDAWPVVSGDIVHVVGTGRAGTFQATSYALLSAREQARANSDTLGGVYIKSAKDTSLVWVRQYDTGYVMAEWFGAVPWVVGGTQDSTAAFQAAADFAGIGGIWRWAGRHRITGKVTVPDYQSFGSFCNTTSVAPQLVLDPAAFTGPNTGTGADKIESAVFFDGLGTAFELGQASQPNNFTIYGRGYIAVDGSKSINDASANTADWHAQVAFRFGKYIKPVNVTVLMTQVAFESVGIGVYSGNYYSTFLNCAAESCCTIFAVRTTPSYNTEIHGGRFRAARFGEFDVGVRNFKVYGGSIEGFSDVTYLRDDSELSFFSTYFETTTAGTLDQFFSTFHTRVIVNVIGCLIYMNNFKTFFGIATPTTGTVLLNSHGNKFMIPAASVDAATSHIIYKMSDISVRAGSLFGDMIVKDASAVTTTYVDGSTASYSPYAAATVV